MKTLIEKSILVSLIISQWAARKYDKKVTREVNEQHNATDAGRFNKSLIAREHLQVINKIANQARAFHYDNTLPWGDNGERLLPSENYFQYVEALARIKNEYETEVNKFSLAYPSMIDEAKINLNGLFNASDYPMDIRTRFNMRTCFMPVADAQDIRVNLSEKEVNELKKYVTEEMQTRFAQAQQSIFERITEQMRLMHEKLNEKDGIFRDSLFNNVLELVDMLPRLNVGNDQRITELCNDLNSLYTDPESVRKSKSLRKEKAQEVDSILSKIDSFFKA